MLFLSCMCATAPQLPLRTLRVGISFPAFLNVFPWVHFCLSCSFSFALSVFFKHLEIFGHPAISRLSFKFHYLFIFNHYFSNLICGCVGAFSGGGGLHAASPQLVFAGGGFSRCGPQAPEGLARQLQLTGLAVSLPVSSGIRQILNCLNHEGSPIQWLSVDGRG